MKEINLSSIINLYKNEGEDLFQKYLDYFGVEIKKTEKSDLLVLVDELKRYKYIVIFDNYFFGFKIPQIGKEFDLLRFGKNYNVNIELKSENVGEEKIKRQLVRNKYYLKFLENKTYYYTFVSNEKKLYFLDENNNLILIKFEELVKKLLGQQIKKVENIDKLFNPLDYLVSPFNSTEKFLEGKYFLTRQQEEFKKSILEEIKQKGNLFIGLTGDPGTGKTLLTYDIAKSFLDNILIIHCGYLNNGHRVLIEKGWNIIGANEIYSEILENDFGEKYNLIIIDEAQRILVKQLDLIIEISNKNNISCIFSYDRKQFLGSWEENKIDIKEVENSFKIFDLTKKIRTNKEISNFIKGFLEKNRVITAYYDSSNIDILYLKNQEEAQFYVNLLLKDNWKLINYTPSNRHIEIQERMPIYNIKGIDDDNVHTVIGQEFDKVIIIIDENFYYDENDKIAIKYPEPYYLPTKMFFQMITRVKQKLFIIIINNDKIMNRCLDLLKK